MSEFEPPRGPSKDRYDVVVVGARCAGASTARLLARAGLDVLVLDRTRLPADTLSTHALMLAGVVQLARWGLLDAVSATGSTPIDGVDITAGPVSFTARVKNIGGVDRLYAPRRILLDAMLADAAVGAGAELCDGFAVDAVLRRAGGGIAGIAGTDASGAYRTIRASWVVGADGIRSTIARAVGAATLRRSAPTSVSHYAYFAGLAGTRYDFTFAPQAGVGAIPTDGGLTCVFINAPSDHLRAMRRDLDAGFHALVEQTSPALHERLRDAQRVGGFRGTRGLPAHLRQAAGDGWLLVGDAGYHRDPYSAHGITDAFRDADLAARAVLVAADSDPTRAMRDYQRQRDDFAVPMYDATSRLASFRLDIDEILEVLSVMGDEGEREARFLAGLGVENDEGAAA
jgi:flavin-dependent dehydrogenase